MVFGTATWDRPGLSASGRPSPSMQKALFTRLPEQRGAITWQDHITTDPNVLSGTPVVRGTRRAVDFLSGRFAAGWNHEAVWTSYRPLSAESLRAVFAYAAEVMHDEAIQLVNRGAA